MKIQHSSVALENYYDICNSKLYVLNFHYPIGYPPLLFMWLVNPIYFNKGGFLISIHRHNLIGTTGLAGGFQTHKKTP